MNKFHHPVVGSALLDQAHIYFQKGDYNKAEEMYQEALSIYKNSLGEEHPLIIRPLLGLAVLSELVKGDYNQAEEMYQEALRIARKAYGGENHPDVASILASRASTMLYFQKGDYNKAEEMYEKALSIYKNSLGEEHPYLVYILGSMMELYLQTNRPDKALQSITQAFAIDDKMILNVFAFTSESQRMAYLETYKVRYLLFLYLVYSELSNIPEARYAAFDLVLRRKAIGMEMLLLQREKMLDEKYPWLKQKIQDLTNLRMKIAEAILRGPDSEGLLIHQERIARWNEEKELREAELARSIPELHLRNNLLRVNLQDVTKALPHGSVLLEFVNINLESAPLGLKLSKYLAFVLHGGSSMNIEIKMLEGGESIDRKINEYIELIREGSDIEDVITEGRKLRAVLFDPIKTVLGYNNRIFIAPDGQLAKLPFEVLPTDDGKWLIDQFQFSYLGTARDLVRYEKIDAQPRSDAIVAVDPDFDLAKGSIALKIKESEHLLLGKQSRELDNTIERFESLTDTREEGEHIAQVLSVRPLIREEVLESTIKQCRSPYILHIATHGFFLSNQKIDYKSTATALTKDMTGLLSGNNLEDPLLRSGLALAGANTWLKRGILPHEAQDGILNAEDVLALDLWGTKLVVLSACETGLGGIVNGEGVFGLRRSFTIAGAQTLIMSLWKVPSEETKRLMIDFYNRLLHDTESRADALRKSQLAMKEESEEYAHPLFWGAFICQGNPAPLSEYT
jgi:CHAT domain-containing protein